jgi:ABC-type ATPase with predicted acetyltransferase domain
MNTLIDNEEIFVGRNLDPKHNNLSLLKDMYVERGTNDDWMQLHELHYKADGKPIGAKVWKCTLGDELIGVIMFSVPKMLLSGRNTAFKHLRPNVNGLDNKLINTTRAIDLNKMFYVNSRLVVDTMYRGAGIAYRFQNIASRMTGKRFIEFQSSMSKFNPFAVKAGFQFVKPKRAANYERGLQFFRRNFDAIPSDFVGVKEELLGMPAPIREKVIKEMRAFYYQYSSMEKSGDNRLNGTSRVDAMSIDDLIKNIQQLVLASPLYGLYENPDYQIELPERVPLLAFDKQSVTSPLILDF